MPRFSPELQRAPLLQRHLALRPFHYWPVDEPPGATFVRNLGTAATTSAEYILNGGFETAGAGGADIWGDWSEVVGTGTITDETTITHGGGHAVKLVSGSGKDTRVSQSPYVVPSSAYTLTFWARGDGTNQGRYQVRDATNGTDLALANTGVTAATWTLVTVPFTTPGNCRQITLNLFNTLGTVGSATYFDDVSIIGPAHAVGRPSSAVKLGAAGVDGRPCAWMQSSYIDLYSPALGNTFPTTNGSISAWGYIPMGSSTLTDGSQHYLLRFKTNAPSPDNAVTFGKEPTTGKFVFQYVDQTVSYSWGPTGMSGDKWHHWAITWGALGAAPFLDGVQIYPYSSLGTWAGAFNSLRCVIGAEYNGVSTPNWHGAAQHCAVFDRQLTPAEIYSIGRLA